MDTRRRFLPVLAAAVVRLAGSAAESQAAREQLLEQLPIQPYRERRPDRRAPAAGPVASAHVLRQRLDERLLDAGQPAPRVDDLQAAGGPRRLFGTCLDQAV